MQKKIVLFVSLLITLFFLFLIVLGFDSCYGNLSCRVIRDAFFPNDWLIVTIIAPVVLVFSLITFWMKDVVFKAWWKFASWYVPVVAILTVFLELYAQGKGGYMGNMDQWFFNMFLFLLGIIFVIVSTVKIVSVHNSSKNL
jgi:hypothetical protein